MRPEDEILSVINFNNVSMKYNTGKNEFYALRKINLTIKKHEKIAVCGRTGSGKTTILNSLLRLYDIDQGEITFKGMNVSDFSKKELRSNIVRLIYCEVIFNAIGCYTTIWIYV